MTSATVSLVPAAAFPLTSEQQEIVRFVRDETGNLGVVARAGAGKTTTIVAMAENMREPSALCLAFNKSIADEMQRRLPPTCRASTINALGYRAWGQYLGEPMQMDTNKNYRLINDQLAKIAASDLKTWHPGIRRELPQILGLSKSAGFVPEGIKNVTPVIADPDEFFDHVDLVMNPQQRQVVIDAALESWEEALIGRMDFGDQVLCPTVCDDAWFTSYPITFVDEAQDLSLLNHRMIEKIVGTERLVVVGDPCQAIYGFRGADEESMGLLMQQFGMEERKLTVSFRCDQSIIRNVHWRAPDMQWREGADEGVVDLMPAWTGSDVPDGAAVVCRNNAPLLTAFVNLLRCDRTPTLKNVAIVDRAVKVLEGFGNPRMRSEDLLKRIDTWEARERAVRRDVAAVADLAECLRFVAGIHGTLAEVVSFLRAAAMREGTITLSTIHSVKGLEYDTVFILDPHLIRPDGQDPNVKYVGETRAKHALYYIRSEGFVFVREEKEAETA